MYLPFQSVRYIGMICLCAGVVFLGGCSDTHVIKRNVKGPVISDSLSNGTSIGIVDNGTFVDGGWQPGLDGSITYDMPGMPQGEISFKVKGLTRSAVETVFLTLYEKTELDYADPFVLQNPYRVTLAIKNFQQSPQSPMEWLWTVKNFPLGTSEKVLYSDALPTEGQSYSQSIQAINEPIYPDTVYIVTMKWQNGKAELWLNRTLVAEHRYAPVLFSADDVRVVIGKSPGLQNDGLPDVIYSDVKIGYPGF